MTDADVIAEYLYHLREAGINVPDVVTAASERQIARQREEHGK